MKQLLMILLLLFAASCGTSSAGKGCEWKKPLWIYGQPEGTTKEDVTNNLRYDADQKIWYSTKYDILTYETETEVLTANKTYEDICK